MSFGLMKFDKMATKFKMASETNNFFILPSKLQFSTDFKKLECIRSAFLLSNFYRKHYFSKIQNGGFFEDDVIFEKKSTFFQTGRSHPKLNFFQIRKRQFCSTKTQDIPKKIAKENFFYPPCKGFLKFCQGTVFMT
jgi:hypothetical protein